MIAWLVTIVATLALSGAPWAQSAITEPICSKVWIGHEIEIEEFLRTAAIEKIEEVPIGVTKPKRAYFTPGGLVRSAAWKPLPPGLRAGYWESYKAEIAAYALDRFLELHMVPPYVERRIKGDLGALSLWVENIKGFDLKHPVTAPNQAAWTREVVRMKMFDQFIGNIDRNQGNVLYDSEYHIILIDHSRAFTDVDNLKRTPSPSRIDRALWNRMLALDETELKAALGKWVKDREIRAMFKRRNLMKAEIDARIAKSGEAAVYLP